jgi:hypothetical protein
LVILGPEIKILVGVFHFSARRLRQKMRHWFWFLSVFDRLPEELIGGVSEHLRYSGLHLSLSQLEIINNLSSTSTLSLF